ncbi:hypothetical protein K501DRAFT_266856 [Backusella circina FSU 941]|nr:hypothetical protein K501DRAFT_266856 [Backusella circina FSU 941]
MRRYGNLGSSSEDGVDEERYYTPRSGTWIDDMEARVEALKRADSHDVPDFSTKDDSYVKKDDKTMYHRMSDKRRCYSEGIANGERLRVMKVHRGRLEYLQHWNLSKYGGNVTLSKVVIDMLKILNYSKPIIQMNFVEYG